MFVDKGPSLSVQVKTRSCEVNVLVTIKVQPTWTTTRPNYLFQFVEAGDNLVFPIRFGVAVFGSNSSFQQQQLGNVGTEVANGSQRLKFHLSFHEEIDQRETTCESKKQNSRIHFVAWPLIKEWRQWTCQWNKTAGSDLDGRRIWTRELFQTGRVDEARCIEQLRRRWIDPKYPKECEYCCCNPCTQNQMFRIPSTGASDAAGNRWCTDHSLQRSWCALLPAFDRTGREPCVTLDTCGKLSVGCHRPPVKERLLPNVRHRPNKTRKSVLWLLDSRRIGRSAISAADYNSDPAWKQETWTVPAIWKDSGR